MPLIRRAIQSGTISGRRFIGVVECDDFQLLAYSDGGPIVDSALRIEKNRFKQAAKSETDILAGKRCLLAIRNGETAEATRDWLAYHVDEFDVGGALILDRADNPQEFADALQLGDLKIPVILVHAGSPLGTSDGPDLRHPSSAPGGRPTEHAPTNPWHAPLRDSSIFELLRFQFLAKAKSVAALSIADLLLMSTEGSAFEYAEADPERAMPLHGLECYPWRLRAGKPAAHSDHIAVRSDERRWISSWCVSPATMPFSARWQPGQIFNLPVASTRPASFRRAMGVSYPAAPISKIVDKSVLYEDSLLLKLMEKAFDRKPIRVPNRLSDNELNSGGVTVVSAMKNEGPFVLDWLAHCRAIGVTDFLIYTNDCEDGTDHLLGLLGDAAVVRQDNRYLETGRVPQRAAFRDADKHSLVTNARWLMTLDVDEYLNIHVGDGKIEDLIEAVPEASVISIPWRLFGNSNIHQFEDCPVVQQFDSCANVYTPRPIQAWAFKTLYRNNGLFERLGIHRPKGLNRSFAQRAIWVNGSGVPLPPNNWRNIWRMTLSTWGNDLAQINHYAVRSAESFLVKRDRGRVNHTKRDQGTNYWFRMNHNLEEDRGIRRFDEQVAKEKSALLALPGVAEAHERAVSWHRNKIRELLQLSDYRSFYDKITSPRMENLSRLHGHFGMGVYLAGPEVIPNEIAQKGPEEDFFFQV